ncbi:hypothetical protein BBJ28_00010847 [Nothophytophthora sp. Chile5]|nr:hypothetical protein BBJ28_00010847 [Nothophytophthora sp. Chile5]
MDLASNEHAYLPPPRGSCAQRRPSRPSASAAVTRDLSQQVAELLLAQATRQLALRRAEQLPIPAARSVDEELLSAEQQLLLAEEDARQERRNAVARQLAMARQTSIAARLDDLVQQFEQQQQEIATASQETEEDGRQRAERRQMTAKVDFVVASSALELRLALQQLQEEQQEGSAVAWTRLLEDLPTQERDYLAQAADERFVEQMKYLKDDREHERYDAIAQHLHGILVLAAPQHNGQQVAKTALHHSLRHLLQAFANIFRDCYAGFLQYGGHGFGLRSGISIDRVTCVLPLVSVDVTQFSAILTQVVLFKYPFLQTSAAQKTAVQRSVLHALFEALQPTLHGLYVAAFQREDAMLDDLAFAARTHRLEFFLIPPRFRLDGLSQRDQQLADDGNERRLRSLRAYSAAVYLMNNLASDRSPWAKLERLARACREIDHAVKAFYDQQPVEQRPSLEEMNVYVCIRISLSSWDANLLLLCVCGIGIWSADRQTI